MVRSPPAGTGVSAPVRFSGVVCRQDEVLAVAMATLILLLRQQDRPFGDCAQLPSPLYWQRAIDAEG
jgi:hypothetical protein